MTKKNGQSKADRVRELAEELGYFNLPDSERAELELVIARRAGYGSKRDAVRKALSRTSGRGAPGVARKAPVTSVAEVRRWLDGDGPQTILHAQECVRFLLAQYDALRRSKR
jgi:hypothetical protein